MTRTILCDFRSTVADRPLLHSPAFTLELRRGALYLIAPGVVLDMEDTANLADGTWHSLGIVTGESGTRIFVDGYQCFSATADLSNIDELHPAPAVRGLETIEAELPETEILARAVHPVPLIEFAAAELDAFDVAQVAELRTGTIVLRFRVRGPGQYGTVLAAAGDGEERLTVLIDAAGIHYRTLTHRGTWRDFTLPGRFDDGEWIDLAITVTGGAVDIYHSGYLDAHLPGRAFFADTAGLDRIVVGQDTKGERLWGEVRDAAIFPVPLNGAQLKRLSGVAPIHTRCLFDSGYDGAVSYRIPSLLTTASGVVIAGADQRETIPNDAPNAVNFVVRRSLDGGDTWGPMSTVVSWPGEGLLGASATDSCLVQDRTSGRVIALLDHFPGGIGQPNAAEGVGVDKQGRYVLSDGTVVADPPPEAFLAAEVAPEGQALTARTSYVQMVFSEDDGATWSQPVNLNQQLKDESMIFLGVAPGCGIQLASGRLLIPMYFNTTANRAHFRCAVAYSDDGGDSWTLGSAPLGETATYESTIVERADGSVLMLMRNQAEIGRVAAAVSEDGGETFGEITFLDDVPEIFSQPNAIRLGDALVFANASQLLPYRGRGVLRLSRDDGATWPIARTFNPKHYVYQCMTQLPDGTLGLLWERETQGLYFTRVPLQWFPAD
ncbi:sialidase [Corynebacterium testudinoris]|uniref:sialidase family protein n=1 Tax=Corynebacterium testudinoris TaxID=136857 RepID=UPI001C8B5DC1|nr:sialidase family protein [Corynebacterium testudinoris]MBX8995134.1 sialidase [Corynebacterium testudinoris]